MQTGHGLLAALTALALLAGCVAPVAVAPLPGVPPVVPLPATGPSPDRINSPQAAANTFVAVIRQMEPAVERECLARRTSPINCDFQFVVDDRPGLDPNAFQTLGRDGRPVIGFTLSLLAAARNKDELAFVVGHEASHHILGHITQKASAANAGAIILTGIAAASGAGAASIRTAQEMGAQLGARYYSRDWELQADYLGAIVTMNAGFDPVHGAAFFDRMPDPGDRILGSHPSRAARQAQVLRAVTDRQAGRVN